MRYEGAWEGDEERPRVLLVEEQPDHAVVLAEILEEQGFRVEIHRVSDARGATVAGPVLLSTATDPEAAARFLADLAARSSRPPVFVLDGPGRRWDPASVAASSAVSGVIAKETDAAFLDRLGDLLRAWRGGRSPAGTGGGGGRTLPMGPCAATLVRVRLARLVRLLERLAPLASLGGPAAAPLAEVLARADELAREAARAAGDPPPRAVVSFRPADLVLVRRRAWEVLTGAPVHVAPGPAPTVARGDLCRVARLFDGLVLGAAVAARHREEAVRLAVQATAPGGFPGELVVRIAPRGVVGTARTCGELAAELGLELAPGDAEMVVSIPREPSRDTTPPPLAVLVAAPPGGPGDAVDSFCRERRARVTRASSEVEVRGLLAAGCLFDAAFLALPGTGLAQELREALPRAALVGLGDATAEDVAQLLEVDGLGWIEAAVRSDDLAAAWRLAAALA